jgi:hypothetical protein
VKIRTTLLFTLFLLPTTFFGQNTIVKKIRGQITTDTKAVSIINIINTSGSTTTITDENGFFSILVTEGDILSFSAVNLEPLRKKITKKDLELEVIKIELIRKSIDLDEVIVYKNTKITAENLGIIPRNQVKLTPAERRLQTAGDFKPIHLLGLLAGSLEVDPILNAISGRTKMLKKEVLIERKEQLLAKMEFLFKDSYYTETLKIPLEYIKDFQYYCIDDPNLAASLVAKNKTMSSFFIVGLAEKYNQIITHETK